MVMRPADVIDAIAASATDLFSSVEVSILRRIARGARTYDLIGNEQQRLRFLRELQAATERALASIPPVAADWYVERIEREGLAQVVAELAGLPVTVYGDALGPDQLGAAADVAASLRSAFDDVKVRITRLPQDVYQRFGAEAIAGRLIGDSTGAQRQLELVQQWYRRGIPAFTDAAGKTWRAGSYIEMATRTGAQRALNQTRIRGLLDVGIDLGQIIERPGACDRCAPWAGRVISLDGRLGGTVTLPSARNGQPVTVSVYGTLDDARADGWGHPNCHGNVVGYLPGASRVQPMEYDEARNKGQAELRRVERALRQARMDEALGLPGATRRVRQSQATIRSMTGPGKLPRLRRRESPDWVLAREEQ